MSQVSICNQALSLVGGKLITSLDDESVEAQLCKLNYDPLREAVLTEHNWTFATQWMTLPALADPPLSEYANAYAVPSDVLDVLFVGQDYNHPTQWQREGQNIVTDESTCKCQVLMSITDTSLFSPIFTQAFVARIAAELAIPIAESETLRQSNMRIYQGKVQRAATRDNQQGKTRRIRSRWLTASRERGYRGAGPYV